MVMLSRILVVGLASFGSFVDAFSSGVPFVQSSSLSPSGTVQQRRIIEPHFAKTKDDSDHEDHHHEEIPPASSFSRRNARPESSSLSFASGAALQRLRRTVQQLRDTHKTSLPAAIAYYEQRDPEVVYAQARWQWAHEQAQFVPSSNVTAVQAKEERLERLQQKAALARKALPRFQLEGLWIGTYGTHGEQLINVTYKGDTLVATKVTGDDDLHVPKGQTTFTADFKPISNPRVTQSSPSPPVVMTTRTSFPGQGQIAQPGHINPKYVTGQWHWQSDGFSFVWYTGGGNPQAPEVRFQRPTAHQILSLLRTPYSQQDEMEQMKDHLRQCWDMDATDALARHYARTTTTTEEEEEPFLVRRIHRWDEWKGLTSDATTTWKPSRKNDKSNSHSLANQLTDNDEDEIEHPWTSAWKRYLSEAMWKNLLMNQNPSTPFVDGDLMAGF